MTMNGHSVSLRTKRFMALATMISLAGALVVGCVTIEEAAPPMSPVMLETADALGVDQDSVARGRIIYLTACVECHRAHPIDDFSIAEWESIVDDMAEKSHLKASGTQALRDYIAVAHEFMTATPSAPARR